ASFVEHIDGQRGEALLSGRIAGRAAAKEKNAGQNRNRVVTDGPDAEPVRQHGFFDSREREVSTARRRRQLRSIDADRLSAHETTAGAEPPTASSGRPRGTMLSVTREAPVR